MIPFESDNLKAYKHLLRIEVILREILKTTLEQEFGTKWQKQLPGNFLVQIRQAQKEESRPNFGYKRLGPLYYLTFGDLVTLLNNRNAASVAKMLGGENVLRQLANIMVPRNAVCHSRPVSSVGLMSIETVLAQIEAALTPERVIKITRNPDTGISQEDFAASILPAIRDIMRRLPQLPTAFTSPDIYQVAITQFWWIDDQMAGFNRAIVDSAMSMIQDYNALPSGVGSLAARQIFIQERKMQEVMYTAICELERFQP